MKAARWLWISLLAPLGTLPAAEPSLTPDLDRETLDQWSAPYRGWHYQPEHVITPEIHRRAPIP